MKVCQAPVFPAGTFPGVVSTPGGLPRADTYQPREVEAAWVRPRGLKTYRRTCANLGAAVGAFASHFTMLGVGAAVGATLAGALGLGVAGAVVAAPVGALAGLRFQSKTWIGRKLLARAGAVVGDVAGGLCWLARIPLRSNHVETAERFSYKTMRGFLGNLNHNGHPRISRLEAEQFVQALEPGDLVLTNDAGSTPFATITHLLTGRSDFTHGIVYAGDGKTIEAKMKGGVLEGDLMDVLQSKHHAIAIHPDYQPGQATAVVDSARDLLGKPYDFKFRLENGGYYCSEAVYEAVKRGAPQIRFATRRPFGREVIVPSDLLKTPDAGVVAEAGVGRTYLDCYMGKFVPE